MRFRFSFVAVSLLAFTSCILAQSSTNLVTVDFDSTFNVRFEDDLGDVFSSGTFKQKNNPGVACNVGLGGGWVFSTSKWQFEPIHLFNAGIKYYSRLLRSIIKASVYSLQTQLLKAPGFATQCANHAL
ncbi:hypothetical protein J3R30DRAFT_3404255 [Lentinula aciculospora]|uniref:Uncharacterized protein n=1 Tax=Lentinula aciculospora TaxID=153920 RepID=A0A9W9AA85_9AGAR|nr:hypothetical protein J3R30DRAFT_3404255 [Lentinula aciculospora]